MGGWNLIDILTKIRAGACYQGKLGLLFPKVVGDRSESMIGDSKQAGEGRMVSRGTVERIRDQRSR